MPGKNLFSTPLVDPIPTILPTQWLYYYNIKCGFPIYSVNEYDNNMFRVTLYDDYDDSFVEIYLRPQEQ